MQNEIILRFCIWGFDDLTHDEITQSLKILPSKIYIKGQKKNPKFGALAKHNGWLFEVTTDRQEPFEYQLKKLLQVIEPKADIIGDFSNRYSCEISCALFIYYDNGESIPSVHINTEYSKIVSRLNLDIDFDIYCLPNE